MLILKLLLPTFIFCFFFFFGRMKEAQENIKKITAEKRVETKKINANSLVRANLIFSKVKEFPKSHLIVMAALKSMCCCQQKERLRQKEANVSSS